MCPRCHCQDRQEVVRQALEKKLWANGGAGDASEARREILSRPQDPRALLKSVVRPAGVTGANAGHAAPAMRKVGLTVAKPSGHTTAPLGEGEWAKQCKCGAPDPHADCTWVCINCRGILWAAAEEEEDVCRIHCR